jgi:hypothetical protein
MQKAPSGNGTIKLPGNIISLAATKPVRCEISKFKYRSRSIKFHFFLSIKQQSQQQQQPNQPYSSNIPTHKQSNNFQQTLPRYNPPPSHALSNQNNPVRRIQRGRYSTGTTSLIPTPGSVLNSQTPLASPALSTTSTALSAQHDNQQQKSHIPFASRIPNQEMLKFQVRKSETESTTANPASSHTSTNAQIQVNFCKYDEVKSVKKTKKVITVNFVTHLRVKVIYVCFSVFDI